MTFPGIKEATEATLKWLDSHIAFRYFALLLLLSVSFLFEINPVLSLLKLPPIDPAYLVISVVCLLLSATGCLFFAIESSYKAIIRHYKKRKFKQAIEHHLYNLPPDQMSVLHKFVESGNSSADFQMNEGAVRDLERRGILYRSSNEGTVFDGFPFTVTPIANEFLKRPEFRKFILKHRD